MQPFLDGMRVLDLTQLLPGPHATTLLSDLGADVVKVERPGVGDPVRHREPYVDDRSYTLLTRNRNKRSVALDLKHERGREAFLELARTADVVFEQFRPGVVERLGVGYDDVRSVNPDVVYCSLSGYGQDGPYADRPGHDLNYIGVAGLLGLTGEPDRPPVPPGYLIADFVGGIYSAFAIVTAYAGVQAGHGGDYIDVSMTDTVASFAGTYIDNYFGHGRRPERGDTTVTGHHPGYRVYEAADGEYLTVAALEERFWENLCAAIGTPELEEHYIGSNERLPDEVQASVVGTIEERIAERPRDEWLERFDEYDVPAGPVNGYDEVFRDPQLRSRDLFGELEVGTPDDPEADSKTVEQIKVPLEFGGDRTVEMTPASHLGADTDELLAEAGYDADEIDELVDAGAAARKHPF